MEIGGGGQVRCTEAQLLISVGFRPQGTGRPDWAEKEGAEEKNKSHEYNLKEREKKNQNRK